MADPLEHKELFLIKKTDFVLDYNPELELAASKILKKVLRNTGFTGGAVLWFDELTNKLRVLTKKGTLDNKLIASSFRLVNDKYTKTRAAIPIALQGKCFGVLYVYGAPVTFSRKKILDDIELLLDGRFRYEQDSFGLRRLFSRYVGGRVVKKIMSSHPKQLSDGERHNCTIVFADLNGFTEYTNNASPELVVKMLNDVFGALIPIALKSKGAISQIVGDELMVVFGSPFPQKDHASRAIRTALAMRKKAMSVFVKEHNGIKGISIGIASGRVVAGNVGHDEFRRYAFVGPKVNLASRLTSLAGTNEILVDEATKSLAKAHKYKRIGLKSLKGFSKNVEVFRVIN